MKHFAARAPLGARAARSAAARTSGFTLLELMIVVAVIAILVAIAIPNLLAAKLQANESQVIGTLRGVTSAQSQFRIAARVDTDNDGAGEFGFLRELSGGVPVRANADWSAQGSVLLTPVLSGGFRTVNSNGEVQRSGYVFRMFLPDVTGAGIPEPATTPLPDAIDAESAETRWACYAYPQNYGSSGARTFFVDQAGIITASNVPSYGGAGSFPRGTVGRAFVGASGASTDTMTGLPAIGTRARDGNLWVSIQ